MNGQYWELVTTPKAAFPGIVLVSGPKARLWALLQEAARLRASGVHCDVRRVVERCA